MKKASILGVLLTVSLTLHLHADAVVVFNEIMYHPSVNESNLEWLELRNQLGNDVDVSGWSLDGAVHYTFPSNSILPASGYVVVAVSPTNLANATGLTNIYGPFTGRLGNNGERLTLVNNSGRVLDEVQYASDGDWPAAPDGSGVSLAKLDPDSASERPENWAPSAQMGGTPGAENFPSTLTGPGTKLISMETAWKYDDSGTDLGVAWRLANYNDTTWAAGALLTNRPVSTLFNTGVGDNRVALAAGSLDPHYILTAAAQGTVGSNAMVELNNTAWIANDASSTWLGVVSQGATSVNAGNYNFLTTFSLDQFIPSTVQINLSVLVDNDLTGVYLNGNASGLAYSGFSAWSTNILTGGFISGTNTLEFRTVNSGTAASPQGFRAVAIGTGLALNNTALAAGRTCYFRKSFVFNGNPAFAKLKMQTLLADGAVFYLNGQEVYRQNMPSGAIQYITPATSNVTTLASSSFVDIPTDSLVTGTNVLAVEVHNAAGNANPVLLGTDLYFTPLSSPSMALAFNEISGSTDSRFWLELNNYGTRDIVLDGCVIYYDGITNLSYTFPSNHVVLAPGGFLSLTNDVLGFHPSSGERLYLFAAGATNVLDSVIVKKTARARYPDGTGNWLLPTATTPEAPNHFVFHNEVVINEIMYQHARVPVVNNPILQESPEQWLELYNRSTNAVDLSGWQLDGGVRFTFTNGTVLAPDSYLVVAKDAITLRQTYPGITILGPYSGNLSRKGESIVLKDPTGNPANKVHYFDGAPWPEYANGGGSSLELRDSNANNTKPEAWASSDETQKSSWVNISYNMVAGVGTNGAQPTQWNDFIFGLLDAGECLIDDIRVLDVSNSSTPIIANGNFENGVTGWRIIGTHCLSRIEPDPENPGSRVLHIIASGPQEHMHNHIETTLLSAVVNGHEYQISYRAKWLAGNSLLNTRLYFNRCARTTQLPRPLLNGTPGARNTRSEPNIGPTFAQLSQTPVVPQPGEPVTVKLTAQDPQGVANVELWWSVNSGPWMSTPMENGGSGSVFSGTIPGYPAWSIVQFYARGVDTLGAVALYPATGTNSGALYAVADGQANLTLGHNVRIILTPANTALLHAPTNVESNFRLPCTIVYDEKRAYYNAGVRLRSSERGRYSDIRTTWHMNFQSDDLFRGVHSCMIMHRSGAGDSTANKQMEILARHMVNHAGNIPGLYSEICRVIAPKSIHTGPVMFAPRHKDLFIETAYPNGGDGVVWKFELIYYPTTTNEYGYKLPNPDNVMGPDIIDLGNDKENYRYNFIIKNHRDADDYTYLMNFAKALSLSGAQLDQATRQTMDVEEWMRSWAILSLCGIGDTYTFGNNHNLVLYQRPSDKKILGFLWDMSFMFNRASNASLVGDKNLSNVINLPGNLRLFYAHMLEIIDSTYNTPYMTYWINHYMKFCPGQDFRSGLTYMQSRVDYAKSVISGAGGLSPFAINTNSLVTFANNLVTISGTAPVTATKLTINGLEYPITWTNLYSWNITLPANSVTNVFNFEAFDVAGNVISNLSTAVTLVNTGLVVQPQGTVLFNELMYNPVVTNAEYVELFNTSSNFVFDLSGWRINGLGFTFPGGSYISNRQHLILAKDRAVFASTYGANIPVFAEFDGNLDKDGETLTLLIPAQNTNETDVVVDKVRYETVPPWPTTANGFGPGLQLIDQTQDNARAANWSSGTMWRYFSYTTNSGTASGTLYLIPQAGAACDFYLDDICLVFGTNANAGTNLLRNSDFELGNATSWTRASGISGSVVTNGLVHGGNFSMHVLSSGGGNLNFALTQVIQGYRQNTNYTLSYWYLAGTNISGLTAQIGDLRVRFNTLNTNFQWMPFTPGVANSVTATLPPFPLLWLNEVQPKNLNTRTNALGQYAPWVELYNSGTNQLDLSGYYLANNYTSNMTQWAFPAGTVINPGEFKLVWLDGGTSTAEELHASFTIPESTGSVVLVRFVNSMPQVMDYLNYSGVGPSLSYGDYPDGQPFSRQVFYNITPETANNAEHASVIINEWMASNVQLNPGGPAGFPDPADQDYDDWFELYNPNDFPVDLVNYFLTDATNNPTQFRIPQGYTVPAHGFLVVWADGETGQNRSTNKDLHVSFQLSRAGEQIRLYDQNTNLVDEVTFGPQTNNVSEGRFADGANPPFYFMGTATPGAPNVYSANHPPTITPVPDQIINMGQTLTITNVASDPDLPPQGLHWSLLTGTNTGATIGANSGVFVWTAPPTLVPSTNVFTIQVQDDGVPPLGTDMSFTVVVLPVHFQLRMTNQGGSLSIVGEATPGYHYRVDYCDQLAPGAIWQTLPGFEEVTANDATLVIPLPPGNSTNRFYRIFQSP